MSARLEVPLFPLPNVVHFPQTELKLHVFEPRYRQMVADLLGDPAERPWVGMAVLKPGNEVEAGRPAIYRSGTVGRLTEVEHLEDGRSNIVLRGEFRFEVDHETLADVPYRRAVVRRVDEPALDEASPSVQLLRRELLEVSRRLSAEAHQFPLDVTQLEVISADESSTSFETLVNTLAADLDLSVRHKLRLLSDTPPQRALNVLSVLRGRQRTLDLLRPYRHLSAGAQFN